MNPERTFWNVLVVRQAVGMSQHRIAPRLDEEESAAAVSWLRRYRKLRAETVAAKCTYFDTVQEGAGELLAASLTRRERKAALSLLDYVGEERVRTLAELEAPSASELLAEAIKRRLDARKAGRESVAQGTK